LIFRSIKAHIENENWFAVCVDFVIVVVGVFIGIQVANWNEDQTFYDRETNLLYELKKETENSILFTKQRILNYSQVVAAGKRSLAFLESGESCETECWPILVDFMHASQWQSVRIPRSTFENMRRLGLPKNNKIVNEIEGYHAQNDGATLANSTLPEYRSLVRQIVTVDAQDFYWRNCFTIVDGVETYDLDCRKGVSDDVAFNIVEAISTNSEIKPQLTEWISAAILLPIALDTQRATIVRALEEIDNELTQR
jgi:hypothetical protein